MFFLNVVENIDPLLWAVAFLLFCWSGNCEEVGIDTQAGKQKDRK